MNRFGGLDGVAGLDEVLDMNQEEIDALIQGENPEGPGVVAGEAGGESTRVNQVPSGDVAGGFLAPTEADWMPWGDVQSHILDAWLDGEENWASESVLALARRLRTSVPELIAVVDATNPIEWAAKRFDKLLERESLRKSGYSWDRIEHAALLKLTRLVETNRINTASDLLAVAKVANSATRNRNAAPSGGINVQINNNMGGQSGDHPELPGAGSLGTIQLTLTQRTVRQLGQERVIDGESTRLSESAEMLGPSDIPELSRMSDKGTNR